ncbi:probable G-protein coupled receptor 141 [Chanos chanos]|uniref:Probable G-protein coupled receptor 141 n=1 Tax=Chanos chanos TaxID=29144 RepID=A0A6J2VGN2_CHACN|nr:probable G-protein coupled receptor 141 [Chanos chanos]
MGSDSNRTYYDLPAAYRYSLLGIYIIVFLGGIVSVAMMIGVLKSNIRSVTTLAVVNLIVVHILFLLSVPFRIYFYAVNHWHLGTNFCKLVSSLIHAHMYVAIIFYVVILVARYVNFFQRPDRMEFYRRLHALGASLAVWVIILCVALPVTFENYGQSKDRNETLCFNFGGALKNPAVVTINYILSAGVLLTTIGLACCQLYILYCVYKKYGQSSFSHQEFWAQIKSLCFVLVMVVCFMPYHLFRIYYVSNYHPDLEMQNEVFLAVTALSCFDMLTFLSRPGCRPACSNCCHF